jgi:hypothetical protein
MGMIFRDKNGYKSTWQIHVKLNKALLTFQIQSREFTLTVLPEQLQFAHKKEIEKEAEIVFSKVVTLIRTLHHTPYIVSRLNFTWHNNPEEEGTRDFTRSMFY